MKKQEIFHPIQYIYNLVLIFTNIDFDTKN